MLIDRIWNQLKARVHAMIQQNRPMYRDDGVDIGPGSVIDVAGTATKSGNVITISAASAATHDIGGASHSDELTDALHGSRSGDLHAGYLLAAGTRVLATLLLGAADVEIKRWAANQWGTVEDLLIMEAAGTSTAVFNARVTGDGVPRVAFLAGGGIQFGPGDAALDTLFYRTADHTLSLGGGDVLRIIGAPGDFGTPVNGMLWYNTTTGTLRIYESDAWRNAHSEKGVISFGFSPQGGQTFLPT